MGMPFKRSAGDKSGIPVYQPGATTYQQLMQLQQPFVPVSCEYPSPSPSASSTTNPQSSTANPNSNNNINAIVNNSNNSNTNNSNINAVVTSSPQHTYNNHLASSEQTDKSEQNTSSTPTPELSATATSVISPPLITIPTNHQQQLPQSSIPNTNPYAVVPYGTATYSTPTVPYSAYSNASIYSHPLTASSSTQSLYADPATIAKEVAQKNYANALKMAAASNAYSGKPLTALSYTGVALNKALIQTPPQTHLPPPSPQHQPHYHYQTQAQTQSQHHVAAAAAAAHNQMNQMVAANQAHMARQMSAAAAVSQSQYAAAAALTHRPPPMFVQAPHQYLRPHVQSAAAALQPNQVQAAAVAAAQQQLLSQNFFYPGLQGYPLGFGTAAQAAAMQAHHLQPSVQQTIPGMQTLPSGQPVQTVNPGAAVVLNPYKKMKTS